MAPSMAPAMASGLPPEAGEMVPENSEMAPENGEMAPAMASVMAPKNGHRTNAKLALLTGIDPVSVARKNKNLPSTR